MSPVKLCVITRGRLFLSILNVYVCKFHNTLRFFHCQQLKACTIVHYGCIQIWAYASFLWATQQNITEGCRKLFSRMFKEFLLHCSHAEIKDSPAVNGAGGSGAFRSVFLRSEVGNAMGLCTWQNRSGYVDSLANQLGCASGDQMYCS